MQDCKMKARNLRYQDEHARVYLQLACRCRSFTVDHGFILVLVQLRELLRLQETAERHLLRKWERCRCALGQAHTCDLACMCPS